MTGLSQSLSLEIALGAREPLRLSLDEARALQRVLNDVLVPQPARPTWGEIGTGSAPCSPVTVSSGTHFLCPDLHNINAS
jgi:hypothetical protein